MSQVRIEYENSKYLEFERCHINTLVGYNQNLKWKVIRSLRRFDEGKRLSSLEEVIYGDDGLNILIDDKKMTNKSLNILFITSSEEMNSELMTTKGSLMYSYLINQLSHNDIQHQYEKIVNEYISLEVKFEEIINKSELDHLTMNLAVPNLEEIIKKATITGMVEQSTYPIHLMNASQLVRTYLHLLKLKLKSDSTQTLIVLRHLSEFLDMRSISLLMNSLRQLAEQYRHLMILNINDLETLSIEGFNTEEIIFAGAEFEQFPPFDVLKQSIYLHYPKEYKGTDEELKADLEVILPTINAKNPMNHSVDMVLSDVVVDLLN